MNRYRTALREWAPVALCAGVLCWSLVLVGITACGLPMPLDTDGIVDFDFEIDDDDSGAPDPVYLAHDSETAGHGIWRVEQARIAGEPGTEYQFSCRAVGIFLPATPVRDLEIVTIDFADILLDSETRFYALVSTPGAPALVVLRDDGSQIARVALPFVPHSFDISPVTRKAYVVEENGPSITRIDLVTNTIDTTGSPTNGAGDALQAATEIRIRDDAGTDELWIGDGALGGVVIVSGALNLLDTIELAAGATPHIDMRPADGVVDAITDSDPATLWEIETSSRWPTSIESVVHGKTISSSESSSGVWFTDFESNGFASLVRTFWQSSIGFHRSFALTVTPTSQLTVGQSSFVALRRDSGMGEVACPDGDAPTAANPSAFARAKFVPNFPTPPPPPAVTYQLTIQSTPGGTFTVTPAPVQGRYAEGTQVTVTAIPDSGFVAALSGFDALSPSGLIGTITMNADRVVAVNFTPEQTATTVTFSTFGSFRCTNGPRLFGCGTATITSRGTVVSFAGAVNRSVVANPGAQTVIGELLVACPSGECGELNFDVAEFAASLEIMVSQSTPFFDNRPFAGSGIFRGAIQLTGSTAQLEWGATGNFAELTAGAAGPFVRYTIVPRLLAVPPSCAAPCVPLLPPNRLTITGTVLVFN